MLVKKLNHAIHIVNKVMASEEVRFSDQGKDALKTVLKGGTGFENSFDRIIKAGKKEVDEVQPKNGTKVKAALPLAGLTKCIVNNG